MRFKGNFGILELSIDGKNVTGVYQKDGELSGELIDNIFKGKWKNKGFEGLVEFTIIDNELTGSWKKGMESGPMKGKWHGKLIEDDDTISAEKKIVLPTELTNQIIEEENPEENLFTIITYAEKQNFNNREWIQYFNQILELKPNGTLAGEFALRLFNSGQEEEALNIIHNESFNVGDDLDYPYFTSRKKFILEHSSNCILLSSNIKFNSEQYKAHLENNPRFISSDERPMKLVIKFLGRLHQIYLCNNSENLDIEKISESQLNVHHTISKIDSDNVIQIELNGIRIYESTLCELGIEPKDLSEYEEFTQFQKSLFFLRKRFNFSENTRRDLNNFNEEFDDECGINLSSNNLLVVDGPIDSEFMDNVPASNRFSYMNYGKYILQTSVIEVDDFRISDLIFVRDYNMDDFEPSADGIPYCVSEVVHNEMGHLELEVDYFDIKDQWAKDCWIGDY